MKQKILFVVYLLFGLMFINAGLNKIFKYIPVPPDLPEKIAKLNNAMLDIGWLLPLVAVVEIIGGVLFIIPRFRALGALIILPVLTGILLTNIFAAPQGLPMAVILVVIELWVIFDNLEKYMPLIKHSESSRTLP